MIRFKTLLAAALACGLALSPVFAEDHDEDEDDFDDDRMEQDEGIDAGRVHAALRRHRPSLERLLSTIQSEYPEAYEDLLYDIDVEDLLYLEEDEDFDDEERGEIDHHLTEIELRLKVEYLAEKARGNKAGAGAKGELRQAVEKLFDHVVESRRREIAELEEEVDEIRKELERLVDNREKAIESRMAQLTGDDFGDW